MDRCLKDKAHFIIAQTIWNNKNGKAVFAEQVFDRCQRKFQDEINRELYKLIEEGGGADGKTPVMQIGNVTTVYAGEAATANVRQDGTDVSGNPIYFTGKFDFSYITFVKNVNNISQFQIQAYGQQHSVETLIAILDGLIDTTASPKSQGVGNTYNLRKLQATEAGLAAIARAEAKGWTITSNV